ncbi:MAG: peptidylprolyl isomerase [Bdellovibrionales bacterium]
MKTLSLLLIFIPLFVQAKTVEKIVAIVNSEIITLSEINEYQKKLKGDALVDQAVLQFKNTDKLVSDRDYLINHLIDEKLIDSEIKKKKLSITFEKVDQEIRRIAAEQGVSRDQLKSALAERGIRFSDYQDFIKTSIERRALIEREVQSKIAITEDDITSYYISKFGTSDNDAFEYRLAHILLLKSNGGEEKALERAEKALASLNSGSAFDAVAEQFSEDPNFTSGGIMGTFKSGEMRPEIEKSVKKLNVGEVSKIISAPFGYQIVKVLKKTLTTNPEIQEKANSIRQVLMMEAVKQDSKIGWPSKRKELIRINQCEY